MPQLILRFCFWLWFQCPNFNLFFELQLLILSIPALDLFVLMNFCYCTLFPLSNLI